MKSLMETYTPLIENLQDLNQEIRQKLSSMPSYTEQEMKNLGQWLEEVEILEETLENLSYIICHHSQLLRREFQTHQPEDTSQVLTVVGS